MVLPDAFGAACARAAADDNPPMETPEKDLDAIVVGGGLAGLTAALHLQKAGKRTLVLERRPTAGGLCGTFELDGHDFVIGCNDFGSGLAKELESLGVDVAFHHPKTRFHFGRHVVTLPPDLATMAPLALRLPGIARALLGARRAEVRTLGQLVDRHISDPLLRDLACVLATGVMRSPDDVELSAVKEDFSKEWAYGYDKTSTPVGGPQVMIDRMVRRFEELGGEVRLGCECTAIERDGANRRVVTSSGAFTAAAVLSSEGRWSDYPEGKRRGLEVASLLFVLDAKFAYPPGFHTIGWFAPGVPEQLRRLEAGARNDEFSFHVFRSDLPAKKDSYTINGFVPMPRGERDQDPARREAILEYVVRRLDRMLPGLASAVRHRRLLSPLEYEERFGFRAAPSPWLAPVGFRKPPSHDPVRGIHLLGNSVHPPGEHAGAAVLSGRLAAAQVLSTLHDVPAR